MNIINLTQGTPEWHAHRRNHFNASDAAAMLNESLYKTRAQLLKECALGITEDIDDATQARFDQGHAFEALARQKLEAELGEQLYPCVAVDGKYSASFDGVTMAEDLIFEHKTLNNSIRNTANAEELSLHYRIQMEQQLMVSGASVCLFVGSIWVGKECTEWKQFEYKSDPQLRQRIIDGWAQFEKDVSEYVAPIEVEAKPTGESPETLPALNIQVTGMVTASNIDAFKQHALSVIGAINKDLKTDQDFANAEKAVKWCGDVESRLAAAKEHALSQTASIDELFKAINDISETARQTRLQLEKLVKTRKESIRTVMVVEARTKLDDHIRAINADLPMVTLPTVHADFDGAIKGKKTIESLQNAINSELANAKAQADSSDRAIRANLAILDEYASEYRFLFNDLQSLIVKPLDDFTATVKLRIAEHKQAEEKRLADERERIRAEEAAKAQAQATPTAELTPLVTDSAPDTIVQAAPEDENEPYTLNLSALNARLGFTVSADFLASIGFEAHIDGRSKLYRESQFKPICNAIIHHLQSL